MSDSGDTTIPANIQHEATYVNKTQEESIPLDNNDSEDLSSTPISSTPADPYTNPQPGTVAYAKYVGPDGVTTYTPVIAREIREVRWFTATPAETAAAGLPEGPITAKGETTDQASSTAVEIPADQFLGEIITSSMMCANIIAILTNHHCPDLTLSLDKSTCSEYPITNGGLGDVFYGRLVDGTPVAIKTIRPYHDPTQMARLYHKRAAKEIYTWSKCKHPNVVELMGLATFHESLAMISRWEENGSLLNYLSRHPDADRCQLSTSICAGLVYLHDNEIVHGDLKGANILIAHDGRPMIMDFGNSNLLDATLRFAQTSTGPSFSLRWTAPEILEGTTSYTTAADIYSLGMTILETFTSNIPFADKPEKSLLMHIVVHKNIPTRPENVFHKKSICADQLWEMLTKCWSLNPGDRPSAEVVWDAHYMRKMKPLTHQELRDETHGARLE